ncbi:MAG: AAA family ATPase [Bacteroidota bacterium]
MKKGFTFGKYLPFHNGHKALIDFATKHCDELFVIVSKSDQEKLNCTTRANWISKTYSKEPRVKVIEFNYLESELPNTSVSSAEVSQVWADQFKLIVPEVDILFTSEPYGDLVADFMGIEHQSFDQDRSLNRISATQIRNGLYDHWTFLPDAVKQHFQKKVAVLGTESTGKSTMASFIIEHYPATLVEEVGRDIIENSNHFSQEHLIKIAHAHVENIKVAVAKLAPLVVMDTDIHITQSYAKFSFGKYMKLDESLYAINAANCYLYLNNDVPFVQDGTRLSEHERNALDASHRNTMTQFDIQLEEINGSYAERERKVMVIIDQLMQSAQQELR